jgi:hypothetical protein
MIYQIESVKTKTGALPPVDKGLGQARDIQARLRGKTQAAQRPFWSTFTPGPFLVPVTRWVE